MLNWCNRFNICAFLDNHRYQLPGHRYECLAGCGSLASVQAPSGQALEQLQAFLDGQTDWIFGHLSYDLKNETEELVSRHTDRIGFPDLQFFVPRYVLQLNEQALTIGTTTGDHEAVWQQIRQEQVASGSNTPPLEIRERMSREAYLAAIRQVQQRILRGDCYELNYCMEYYAQAPALEPQAVYRSLTCLSPNPFSAFYRLGSSFLLCASPERFLKREGDQLLSQPIKGTERRNLADPLADEQLRQELLHSPKERSENVMVVDLVRNDLSRVCTRGSVTVDELFGIYSFPQLHQMISTVRGSLLPGTRFTDIIRATFPMGSMTGAPKRRVMELIDELEQSRRGLFSGAVGYITPAGDFDFNVVIRSILYNQATGDLSYMVGSGITWYADPEKEYEECRLKAAAMQSILQGATC
ncbi:MAG TPA: anthranilate synthase component I family protein [Lacibacter sp.]|nr:anthranilate synthase component I family protein [Lacibacter sp.]HMO87894.1 anthranilate synthase component I family protein [Lacibacter sp.]HMP87200.1 anthranilate synthase component I family protein [Lacibacter sp.]